jgi:hypothetical protein
MAEDTSKKLIAVLSGEGMFQYIKNSGEILAEAFEIAERYLERSPSEDAVFKAAFFLYMADLEYHRPKREDLVVYSLREMAGLKDTNEAREVYRELKME